VSVCVGSASAAAHSASTCSEQAANRIERSGDVHVQMSVHAAGDSACCFYDGHGHGGFKG